jgi:tetratricopeptide (TPR) repeat protein
LDELADKSAQTMGLVVQREQQRLTNRPAPGDAAADAWLKGRFAAIEYWNTRDPAQFADAERRLLRALELQPAFVDAMADLAQLYLSAAYPPNGNQSNLFDKAEKLAKGAITLDPESGLAQTVLGGVYTDTGRARLGVPHLLRAAELSPHNPNSHNFLSIAYEAMGFWESSLFEREKAIERDPLLEGIQSGGMPLLVRLGRMEEARRVLDLHAAGSEMWGLRMGRFYLMTGDPKRAESVLLQTRPRRPTPDDSFELSIALAKAAQGGPEIAKRATKEFASTERRRWESFIELCALSGEKDLLVDQIENHTYVRNYRWVVSERLLRPYRNYPPYRNLVYALHDEWKRNLDLFGPSLPVQPQKLPGPDDYLSQP